MPPFLLFDGYGTLLELDDFYARLQSGFARRGARFSSEAIRRAARVEMKHYIANAMRARDEPSREILRLECAGVLADELRAEQYSFDWKDEAVREVLVEALVFRAFPEVEAALRELTARGVEMGVLSNWDFGLSHELEKLGLAQYFRFVLTSAQCGAQKPERAIFELGLQNARQEYCSVGDLACFYIGDHYENDVLGARAAGLFPLWLVRDERDVAAGETHEANDEVARLSSLQDLPRLA